jgi:signal transduction histidine kinase
MKKNSSSEFFLLTGIAQKINAPLKSLLLSSEKLLNTYKAKKFEYISYNDFKNLLRTLEQMNKEIHRCYDTTQRLVNLQQSKPDQEGCDINEVITSILELLQQSFTLNKIKHQVRLAKELPLVKLNRVDGHQVIHNILTNAIQAMPGGGTIKIRSLWDSKLKKVIVEISDTGIGITPEHLSKVFEPFFTTKDYGVEKSSGLGLSVVNAIMKGIGGDIYVESSLRKGTQVRISIPLASV